MARLQSRTNIRIATTSIPIIACATLISMRVLPQIAVLWWGLLIASVALSIIVVSRDMGRDSSSRNRGNGRG